MMPGFFQAGSGVNIFNPEYKESSFAGIYMKGYVMQFSDFT